MCVVVNINKDSYDVYIGRHVDTQIGKWGNPYSSKPGTLAKYKTKTRKESILMYEQYLLSNTELLNDLPELMYKTLGCFCKPKTCHGDILKKYVTKLENDLPLTLF